MLRQFLKGRKFNGTTDIQSAVLQAECKSRQRCSRCVRKIYSKRMPVPASPASCNCVTFCRLRSSRTRFPISVTVFSSICFILKSFALPSGKISHHLRKVNTQYYRSVLLHFIVTISTYLYHPPNPPTRIPTCLRQNK